LGLLAPLILLPVFILPPFVVGYFIGKGRGYKQGIEAAERMFKERGGR
jgi:hypothetical protein